MLALKADVSPIGAKPTKCKKMQKYFTYKYVVPETNNI